MSSTCLLIPPETDAPVHMFPITVIDWTAETRQTGSHLQGLPVPQAVIARTCCTSTHRRVSVCAFVLLCPIVLLIRFWGNTNRLTTHLESPWAVQVCVLCVTCDRCPGMCIDWLNAALIRLDWPLQPSHLDFNIFPFPSGPRPHSFQTHFLLLSPSSSTLSN